MLEIRNIKKYYGDRLILDIQDFKAYDGERIGIVGANGAGKTTFLDIVSGRNTPDEGTVRRYGELSYITQLELEADSEVDGRMAKEFGLDYSSLDTASGGEKTRFKIASGLSGSSNILLADEPTSNLDIQGIELLETKLSSYNGLLILVSHDRELLDKLCNKIIEVEGGRLKQYNGSYSQYRQQKEQEIERAQFEYEQYMTDKRALEEAISEKKGKASSMKKTPSRMGNSEARLHKMGNQKAKESLNRAIKAMETRISKLEVKEKPKELQRARIDISEGDKPVSRVLISGRDITKGFGSKQLFRNAEFEVLNGSKTALVGGNGTGKSTLLKLIMGGSDEIKLANGVKSGYFSQGTEILEDELSILENVMKDSVRPEHVARTMLARLLFLRDDVYKKARQLSGGERVRTCFAKIFCSDANVIILDEPTNYLDIYSMEAVENALKLYEGTLFFVSHDRKLISSVADRIIMIEDCKLNTFEGTYAEYAEFNKRAMTNDVLDKQKQRLILETKLSEILSRLSMPGKGDDVAQLDMEYKKLLEEIKRLRESSK
ncbi:MAG TPA: ABC-F type ribosomal protection protein [Candidatus Nitrosocosmicus sp.]|nr:ABC-F type ribosomal protection protein [Candidatus Nitrosocosmicus sp.]